MASGAALLPMTATIMLSMVAVAPKVTTRFGPKAPIVAGRHRDPVRQATEGGLASGIVNTSYQVGSALGLALMTALAAIALIRTPKSTSSASETREPVAA